jgi:hypothetical protein
MEHLADEALANFARQSPNFIEPVLTSVKRDRYQLVEALLLENVVIVEELENASQIDTGWSRTAKTGSTVYPHQRSGIASGPPSAT